ncbi:hypothetical protein M8C21_032549 [Ambrosia artemisiifolia]|uniref:Terpene synthase metal-binding domain-containing protein n=1 Tax=Ambrosia artemisiifolia TaxID=4212 RepID=A0AAD5CRM0_AMBAR|nr:hypothetical protein M8C21_032549 [Ambrosia artemisiifolia]
MVPRLETKWFIEAYEKRNSMNPTLLELAKLDFNKVQAIHQEDLKYTSRWWNKTTWDAKLTSLRDRLVECFLWAVAANSLPPFSPLRRILAQVIAMTTTIDDVYDVYGTLDELEQFTEAISSGKAYLKEAKWYNSGYTPTLEEYLENAWVSISVPLMLTHISYLTSVTPTEEIMHSMERIENIIRYSGIILRLADDLGTYTDEMARGDNPKAVQCYMHETGATEEEARMYVTTLILNTWKKLNKERSTILDSQILKELTDCGANLGRMAQFMYYDEDGHGSRPDITKYHVLSLLVNPI